jgi:hypothetical protein
LQESELLRRQPDFAAIAGYPVGSGIEGYAEVLDLRLRSTGLPTQECADACGELVEIERFYEIVIRAGVESLHAVRHGIASGNNEDRQCLLPRSQTL